MKIQRSATLYYWHGEIFVLSRWETTRGLAIDSEPVFTLSKSSPSEEVGKAILEALASFRTGREHPAGPKEWKKVPKPLLILTGLKSYLPIWQEGTVCSVSEREDELAFLLGKKGRARNTWLFEGKPVTVPKNAPLAEIGEVVRRLFTAAPSAPPKRAASRLSRSRSPKPSAKHKGKDLA
jgi:hypothetical protein